MNKKKYQLIVGSILFLIPLVTIPGDLELIPEAQKSLYLIEKIFFSFIGLFITVATLINKKGFKYFNNTLFISTLAYTVINTYFITGYYVVYFQALGGFTLFLSIPRKLYLSAAAITTPILLHAINSSYSGYSIIANPVERFKFDSSFGLVLFMFIFVIGKFYLDKEKKAKLEAEQKIEEQTKEISLKNNQLEDMMDEKTTLLHVLLHDITSPIQMILLNDQNLISQNEKIRVKSAKNVNKYVGYITDIINNVRQIEAVKSGKKSLNLEGINVKEAINDVLDLYSSKLEDKNLAVKVNILLNDKVFALAEKTSLINSVLGNILSNAIKFSNDNDQITIYAYEVEDTIHIEITDRGIGIPQEIASNLFSRTKETSRRGINGERGTGFGMPLTQAFVDKYDGEIHVQSKCKDLHGELSGTRMTVILNKVILEKSNSKSKEFNPISSPSL